MGADVGCDVMTLVFVPTGFICMASNTKEGEEYGDGLYLLFASISLRN